MLNLQKLRHDPAYVLLITQTFSTISYAVLYSTLVLFMTMRLHLRSTDANALMGLFIAFNYGLHLLGGYIGGRLLSYRHLFLIGMLLQILACLLLAFQTLSSLYWGLSLFLTGSGLNVPCVNMMLTQQFKPDSRQARETAFFWNYAGMNVGFFAGFLVAGYFQLQLNFYTLFVLAALTNLLACVPMLIGWGAVGDRSTPLVKQANNNRAFLARRAVWGSLTILGLIVILPFLLRRSGITNLLMIAIGVIMFLVFGVLAILEKDTGSKKRIVAYIILGLGGLVFWSLYQLAPMGLTLFAQYNVDRRIAGFIIPPQWIGNINTIIIAIGGIVLPLFFKRIRQRFLFGLPLQFAFSLVFVALGFLVLPLGIYLAQSNGLMDFSWIGLSYVLQSIGELLIGPIGYAMIGLLATENLQGLMMGSWMLLTGGTSGVIASYLSNFAIHETVSNSPLMTNPGYSRMFLYIGIAAAITAMVLFLLVPFLRRLIGERSLATR